MTKATGLLEATCFRLRTSLLALVCAIALYRCASADETGRITFDFETSDLQGWQITEGRFDRLICDRPFFHHQPNTPYNKQGKWFLTTLERGDGQPDDLMTGVIESPVFVLSAPKMSLLVGGGAHAETYVALCAIDGREQFSARGRNDQKMVRVEWNASNLVGKPVYLKVVDHHTGGWGHITFDDFIAEGRIDADATARRAAEAQERRLKEMRDALIARAARVAYALADRIATFGTESGGALQTELDAIVVRVKAADIREIAGLNGEFDAFSHKALTANPLLTVHPILYVVRPQYLPDHHNTETMFQTGEINTGSFRGGGALKMIDFARGGETKTLIEVPDGIARDPEMSFDGRRIVFSMRRNRDDDYHIYVINSDGSDLKQLTFGSGITDIDPIYLPDGGIVFTSTREPKYCHCNRHIMGNLFRMDGDGANITQIGRNTLFEGHPCLMPDGSIMYDRWEYVDRQFGPSFGLWLTNPDGTSHTLHYGNNAWSPGGIIDARPVPDSQWIVATFTSCHDRPWGAIAVVDKRLGMDGTKPIVKSWPADISRFLNVNVVGGIDVFKQVEPKYEDPYPLSDKYFLCSRAISGETMGMFLIDVFGNETLIHSEGAGCYDPMPMSPRRRPGCMPDFSDLSKSEGVFYVADVYRGSGMESVPRGTVKYLRIIEAPPKLFWTNQLWNIDATQAPAMNWNSTNNKRILGDVPVEADGSAYFAIPADKFIYFQALDENRMMIQSMRSGTTIRPGERAGCAGCHENRLTSAPNPRQPLAMKRQPDKLESWHGPAREFNYLTEVQPVFDRYCVKCHDYGKPGSAKLNLSGDLGLVFNTSYLELRRKSAVRWFPDKPGDAKLLVKAVDDGPPDVLPPYAWGSHRSRIVDVIRSGHNDVKMDRESFERIVTWIDLNAVYYGSYATAWPDNPFGRSPLDGGQVARLSELTGITLHETSSEMQGSQVNFTRPELSPCLARLKEGDPKRAEALAIIRRGAAILAETPRADMPGFRIVRETETRQQKKYDARLELEAQTRRAIIEGRKVRLD
ncbi:MAG TPA: hypothetical protein PL033_10490 [Candidatus Brocadiia bacterium]|nr:hypothetical protein [Candidatus Brocadiia bacterium]